MTTLDRIGNWLIGIGVAICVFAVVNACAPVAMTRPASAIQTQSAVWKDEGDGLRSIEVSNNTTCYVAGGAMSCVVNRS